MKRRELLKLIVGVALVAVLAISIPLMSSCAPKPAVPTPAAPTPAEPTPAEPTPAEPAAEEPTYNWRIQVAFAPAQVQEITRPWLDELELAFGGRVKFSAYGSCELVPDDQTLPALRDGTLDFVHSCGIIAAAPFDIAEVETVCAFCWQSASEMLVLYDYKGLRELAQEAYDELGVHWLGPVPHDPSHLQATRPLEKYEDFDGLLINCFACTARIFEEAGATSVFVPPEEFYLAGQTGVVDALGWCGAKEGYTNSWNEVYPYFLTNCMCGNATCFLAINQDLWDSLPSDMQGILDMGAKTLIERQWLYYYEGECASRKYFTLTTLPDEDWARIRQPAIEYWDEIAKISPRAAKWMEIVKAYNAEVEAANWYR